MFASFCLFPRNRQTDDYLSQSYNFFRRFDKFFAPFNLAERQDVGRLVFASIRFIQRPHSFPADQPKLTSAPWPRAKPRGFFISSSAASAACLRRFSSILVLVRLLISIILIWPFLLSQSY